MRIYCQRGQDQTYRDSEVDGRDRITRDEIVENPLDGFECVDIVREECQNPGQSEEWEGWNWRDAERQMVLHDPRTMMKCDRAEDRRRQAVVVEVCC